MFKKIKFTYKKIVALGFILFPSLALADTNSDVLSSVLSGLLDLLTSDIARILFVLSVVGIGYGWLYLGRIPQGRAIGAIFGIGIIFSAGWIAQQLGVGY